VRHRVRHRVKSRVRHRVKVRVRARVRARVRVLGHLRHDLATQRGREPIKQVGIA